MRISHTIQFILVLLTLCMLYVLISSKTSEGFEGANTGSGIVPGIDDGQKRFNKFMNVVNLTQPSIDLSSSTQSVNGAIGTPIYGKKGATGSFSQSGMKTFNTLTTSPPGLAAARQCEKTKAASCDAFSDSVFAANCGISFDKDGLDSGGNPHMGGLYLSPEDRLAQSTAGGGNGVFQPTIGTVKKGMFAADQSSCAVIQQEIDCKKKRNFGVENCAQCMTSGAWHRVDPATPRIPPTFTLQGSANSVTIQTPTAGNINVSINTDSGTQVVIPSPGIAEYNTFLINVNGDPGNCFLSGYITGQTARGPYNLDINALIDLDTVTNYKPRIAGTQTVGSMTCMVLTPGNGLGSMTLRVHLPFSFVSPTEADAANCDNGPFITTEASATYLASDTCYGPSSQPGKYSLECLQQMFTQLGGTTSGTGYPTNQTSAHSLLFDGQGNAQNLDQISEFLNGMNIQASTGRDVSGNTLSTSDWNTASMFCSGTPITSPCGLGNPAEIPSRDCMTLLYQNGGAGTSTGPTYTLPNQYTSLSGGGTVTPTYCTASGTLSPITDAGYAAAQAAGNIAAVKNLYNAAHQTANNNTLTDSQRSQAIAQCYGTTVLQHSPEPYFVGGAKSQPIYAYTLNQASTICQQFGGTVASTAQLQQAYNTYGANWCATGWVSDSSGAVYPISTQAGTPGCNSTPGIAQHTPGNGLAGVNCYGQKPALAAVPTGTTILPFNTTTWYMDQNTAAQQQAATPSSGGTSGIFVMTGGGAQYGYKVWYADSNLLQRTMAWAQIAGQVTSISLAPNGSLFATNNANQIFFLSAYNSTTSEFIEIPGSLRQISTDGVNVTGTNAANDAYTATVEEAVAGRWSQLPSVLTKIVTFNNQYYCIGLDTYIYYMTSPTAQWIHTFGSGEFIDIAMDNGVVVLVGADHVLYYSDSQLFTPTGGFQQVPNQPSTFNKISLSNGSIYAIDVSGTPWYASSYKTGIWTQVLGGGQVSPSHRVTTP